MQDKGLGLAHLRQVAGDVLTRNEPRYDSSGDGTKLFVAEVNHLARFRALELLQRDGDLKLGATSLRLELQQDHIESLTGELDELRMQLKDARSRITGGLQARRAQPGRSARWPPAV